MTSLITKLVSQKKILLILVIFLIATILRFYNFEERINFGPEQAVSLITSASYLEKPSLLGLPSVRRTTSHGHIIHFEPFFTYTLTPLVLMFDYDPIPITALFAILNLFTACLLCLVTKKMFNQMVAFGSTTLFLFNTTMISHSLFIWINNYTVLITVLLIYCLWRYKKHKDHLSVLLIGVLTGINVGLEYMYVLTGLPLVLLALYKMTKNRIKSMIYYSLGFVVASFPTIVFDLRHDFYHLRTLWQYLLDTFNNPGLTSFDYYHFLQFWPIFSILGGIFLFALYKASRFTAVLVLLVYTIINLSSPQISFDNAVGMPERLNYSILDRTAQHIAVDSSDNFNIATTYDFDTRAHPLRYLLEYRYSKKSNGVEEYPQSSTLYVLASTDYNFNLSPWEISSFNPTKTTVLKRINSEFDLYKLKK